MWRGRGEGLRAEEAEASVMLVCGLHQEFEQQRGGWPPGFRPFLVWQEQQRGGWPPGFRPFLVWQEQQREGAGPLVLDHFWCGKSSREGGWPPGFRPFLVW